MARKNGTLAELRAIAEQAAGNCPDRWEPLWTVAECEFRSGNVDRAEQAASKAIELADATADHLGSALGRYRLGWISFRAGRLSDSEEHYRAALRDAEMTGRKDLLAQVLNGLAGLLLETGRYGEVHGLMERAILLLREIGLAPYARRVALNRAVVLMLLGDSLRAEKILEQVYEESLQPLDPYVLPRAAFTLGSLHRRMNRLEEALSWYARVPEDAGTDVIGLTHLARGLVSTQLGRYDEAAGHFDLAAATTTPVDRLLTEAYRAEMKAAAGFPEEALLIVEPIIFQAEKIGAENVCWLARKIKAGALIDLGKHAQAVGPLRLAAGTLDNQGHSLNPLREGLRYLRERADVYSDLATALSGPGVETTQDQILQAVEKTHARALRYVLAGERTDPARVDLSSMQAGLRPGDLILDFAIGRRRGVVLAIGPDTFMARQVPGWDRLAEDVRRYRSTLTRPLRSSEAMLDPMKDLERGVKHGVRITETLLEPVRSVLDGAKRIYVIPDRELSQIPFSAVPWTESDGRRGFLGEFFETALLPMAGHPPELHAPRPAILLAGDPVAPDDGSLPELPMAGEELKAIGRVWQGAEPTVLERDSLTRSGLVEALTPGTGMLHLATHAFASASDPSRCAVFLSHGEKLGMSDIPSLPLESSMVILSACSTGSGEVVPGQGIIGLSWAFLIAGADALAASMWSVEDDSATDLMITFHTLLKNGNDPVSAMTLARRHLSEKREHPAYWAPFIMIVSPGRGG